MNTALTLRNWIIVYYIAEYEQSGKDRAEYGKQLFKAIAESLLKKGLKSIRDRFYEVHAIQNNWSVRDSKRAIESLLYERTGLSTDKEATLKKHRAQNDVKLEDIFRNTYLLEFLGLEEKPSYNESDLEESIITNLQNFLV